MAENKTSLYPGPLVLGHNLIYLYPHPDVFSIFILIRYLYPHPVGQLEEVRWVKLNGPLPEKNPAILFRFFKKKYKKSSSKNYGRRKQQERGTFREEGESDDEGCFLLL
jgi:hypothetical protein